MRRERVVEYEWIGGMRLICLSLVLAASACGGGNGEEQDGGSSTA